MSSFGDGEARLLSLQLQEQSRYLDFVGPEFDQVFGSNATCVRPIAPCSPVSLRSISSSL